MFRSDHEEMVAELREQIVELKTRLHPPAPPEAQPQPERPVPSLDEFEAARAATKARLRSVMRTRPSLLGREMQRVKVEDEMEKRRRAHGTHPAQVMFEAAKQGVS
jgi:hypothetical protein